MKSFKEKLGETVNPPKSEDEKKFADKHKVDKKNHPVATKTQFTSDKTKDLSKKASYKPGEDESVYEEKGSMIKCPDCGESYKQGTDHECRDMSEEMTDAQMKKREEIVKSMKKKMSDFKDKYGDRAKEVMYATATKMAMKEETLNENPQEEIPMMKRQLEFIAYAAEEISEYVSMQGIDPEEWFQNKLAGAHDQIRTLHSYIEGDKRVRSAKMNMTPVGEEFDQIDEAYTPGKMKLKDGSSVNVTKEEAVALNQLFQELNSSNKKKMEKKMMESKKGFDEIAKFAKEAM